MITTLFRSRSAVAAITAIFFCISPPAAWADSSNENHTLHERDVRTHPSQGEVRSVQGARAILVTTTKGAFATLSTRGLTPGHAYTLWWVVINEPSACAASPCTPSDVFKRGDLTKADVGYGDGLIAGEAGTGRFASYLPVGVIKQGWVGNGFQSPDRAEIHLVVNDHGPLLPAMARSMLASYRGGCAHHSIPALFPATAKADGVPGPNTCRLVQVAIFKPASEKSVQAK